MSVKARIGVHCNVHENVFAPARNADFLLNILEYMKMSIVCKIPTYDQWPVSVSNVLYSLIREQTAVINISFIMVACDITNHNTQIIAISVATKYRPKWLILYIYIIDNY